MSAALPDDLDSLEEALLTGIDALAPAMETETRLDPLVAAECFEAQVTSRLLDHTARWLRSTQGAGYYTIGSAGHESNAAVALALRPTDPALLHYRSGGFYVARASQVPGHDAVGDVLRGMLARTTEPMSGGRHKVFGHHDLAVIPQTSTIASHLPRAVGLARSFEHLAQGVEPTFPADSIVVCSFGDASLNHSTAQGALNWASLTAHAGARVPIVFLCEDNGLGISVPSPQGWVDRAVDGRSDLLVAHCDGDDPAGVYATARSLVDRVRNERCPALLHLRTVRFLGHAGTDVESAYRPPADLRADIARDPILATARLLVESGDSSSDELVDWYLEQRMTIRARALDVLDEPEHTSAASVMAPLAPPRADAIQRSAAAMAVPASDGSAPDRQTLAQSLNAALVGVLSTRPGALVFGEDVGRKGGVYGVTRGLQSRFGVDRVFDTILDEQSVLGLALGAGINGLLPIPEIQYLAYLHNAEDQLRGEAATLGFFSERRYRNPMVVRIAGYGYQKGFGGHFHNDNAIAVLRDIPGIVIASPAHPSDAGPMLRTCAAAAGTDGAVCVFVEPIALYHTTDLHSEGDGRWLAPPDDGAHVPIGRARVHETGSDLTIVSWANGLYLSLRAARRLADAHGIRARVVDLRWLAPLPVDDLLREASATGRVLVVDETRHSGGMGEGIIAALVEGGFRGAMRRVAARDSFVPLGAAATLVLVSEDDIVTAATAPGERW